MRPGRTLQSSMFNRLYKTQPPPKFAHELLGAVHRLVMAYCKEKLIPEKEGNLFFGKLQASAAGLRAGDISIVRAGPGHARPRLPAERAPGRGAGTVDVGPADWCHIHTWCRLTDLMRCVQTGSTWSSAPC